MVVGVEASQGALRHLPAAADQTPGQGELGPDDVAQGNLTGGVHRHCCKCVIMWQCRR